MIDSTMKKTNLFWGTLLALAAASCTMEENNRAPQPVEQEITIKAVREEDDADTRTYRDDNDGSIWWVPGDAISLFYGSGTNGGSKFTSTGTDTAKVTNFTGVITAITGGGEISVEDTYFWGLYPYSEDASCDGTSVTMTLPGNQTAVPGTFATNTFPSIGRSQGLIMGFYNICSGMKFSVTKEGIKKVTLKSRNGELITGKAKVRFEDGIPVAEIINGSDEVVLEAPAGEYFEVGKYYFLVMFPTTFTDGFTVTLETFTEEATVEKTGKITARRSNFGRIANIDANASYSKKTGNIPVEDANFKAYLVENFDGNGDGEISYEEADWVSVIKLDYRFGLYIKSLEGIEYFPNLDTLVCGTGSANASTFYVAENEGETVEEVLGQMRESAISSYNANPRGLTNILDLSNNLNLRYLELFGHPMLQGINLCSNKELTDLWCYGSMQTGISLDLSNNTKLKIITCQNCYLTGRLDLSNLGELNKVDLRGSALSDVVLGNLPNLVSFAISSPALMSLDVTSCPSLQTIYCRCQYIETLDVSGCPDLRKFYCSAPLGTGGSDRTGYIPYGNLKSLDLTNNSKLEYLDCSGSNLEGVLDVTNCPNLTDVIAYYTEIDELRLGNQPSLKKLYLAGCWNLTSLDLSGCPNLEWISTYACDHLSAVDFTHCSKLKTLYMPPSGSIFATCDELEECNLNAESEDKLVYFPHLKRFATWHFSSLDLSHNPEIESLSIGTTNCTTLDLSPCVNLKELTVGGWSSFETLDISKNLKLEYVTFEGCESLRTLYVAEGQNIEGITVNRSNDIISPNTQVLIKPDDGGGEGTGEDDWGGNG